MPDLDLTRRHALTGVVVGGLSLPVLAACGCHRTLRRPSPAPRRPRPASPAPRRPRRAAGERPPWCRSSQVPVGGGVILQQQNIVVTQPTKDTFEGFSATCTHQGCQLATVSDGTINCACHGSQFAITDGANVTGPSGSPAGSVAALGKVAVKRQGPDVVQG